MPHTFHGATADALGHAIVAGQYAVGTALPIESELCQQFGVSRTVVREAVKSLAAKGLIVAAPKVGTRVQPQDAWNWFDPQVIRWQTTAGLPPQFLRDLLDLRRVVEPAAVRLASERATADDIARIQEAFNGMVAGVEGRGDYIASDLAFHQAILRACRNRLLTQMSNALAALLRTSFEVSVAGGAGPSASLPDHERVLKAIARHDAEAAAAAINSIIDGAQHDMEASLSAKPGRGTRLRQPRPVRSTGAEARRKVAA